MLPGAQLKILPRPPRSANVRSAGSLRCWECPLFACAVRRRRFPVGASPTRRTLQPEATGAVMEVTAIVKANKYRPFSASKPAERGGNS
jgi:hypothetical protein